MPTATLNGTVIAEASDEEVVLIEGNVYFPPSAVREGVLTESPTPYTCPWKGAAQYFTVQVDGGDAYPDRAWSYPEPFETAITRVGRDFAGYVAFSKEIHVRREAAA